MAKAEFYTVSESLVGALDGEEVEYQKGEVVRGTDPAVAKWPRHFEPLVLREHRRAAVEQATAAPGEQRELTGKALTTDSIRPRKRGG